MIDFIQGLLRAAAWLAFWAGIAGFLMLAISSVCNWAARKVHDR